MDVAFWRRWHRWIGFPAALFLCWAATTGMIVAAREFWGEDEALREATRDLVSSVTTASDPVVWQAPVAKAFGDGGLVVAMFWAFALIVLTVSGLIIYLLMRGNRHLPGIQRVFW